MCKKQINRSYSSSPNQVVIECIDGSLLFVTVGEKGATVSYAPDTSHFPEPMQIDDKGRERYPTEFTPFNPAYDSF
jgi:hypothetical protein